MISGRFNTSRKWKTLLTVSVVLPGALLLGWTAVGAAATSSSPTPTRYNAARLVTEDSVARAQVATPYHIYSFPDEAFALDNLASNTTSDPKEGSVHAIDQWYVDQSGAHFHIWMMDQKYVEDTFGPYLQKIGEEAKPVTTASGAAWYRTLVPRPGADLVQLERFVGGAAITIDGPFDDQTMLKYADELS